MAESGSDFPPQARGRAQFAARARTAPNEDVWFTIGQGWAFEEDGSSGYTVVLTMTPTNWDGTLILVPIPEGDSETDSAD